MDLEQPGRFFYIFTRPQWRSWLVKGAFLLAGYGAVLVLHLVLAVGGAPAGALRLLAVIGGPLALLAAVYTAYLFAQAKARDLWQNPLLPPHLAVQAALAGSCALLPAALVWEPRAAPALAILLAAGVAVHLLFVLGETTLTHATAHARLAQWEMIRGRFRRFFWCGIALALVAAAAPLAGASGALAAAAAALTGLLAFEHAYVQAGQSVPLA